MKTKILFSKIIIRPLTGFLLLWTFSFHVSAQQSEDVASTLIQRAQDIHSFFQYMPQEKVYLHFDNTSYYQDDPIWFTCYVLTSGTQPGIEVSKTLYVELLNPGGEIIDKRILKIENGQCHGEFTLNQLPFYSGFYEVRAYTRYMLNFGEDVIFSRLLPVYDKPKNEGDFTEKAMQKYGTGKYPVEREKPQKGRKVNLKFFPEGGNLVEGLTSKVAFEATDASGSPIGVSGTVINEAREEVARFTMQHEGKGVFSYTPGNKHKAVVRHNGKTYEFEMPPALPQGMVWSVDNLSEADSIHVRIQKNRNTPDEMFGVALMSWNKLETFCLINMTGEDTQIKIDQSKLPSGVSRLVLFGSDGKIRCDRFLFTQQNEQLDIRLKTEKKVYAPYERVDMDFELTDQEQHPVRIPFSLSVKDGMNEVEYRHNILTDLLLMSGIKGYVRNPGYYFESDDARHRASLDLLLMVQGWRRYSWEQVTGAGSFDWKHRPEQGIMTQGKVVSFVRQIPKPNVDVSLFLSKREENNEANTFFSSFVTDSLGQFSFVSDVEGKWNMLLSVREKGKKKDYRILLDRVFTPAPRSYSYPEMQVVLAGTEKENPIDEIKPDSLSESYESFLTFYKDSLARTGNREKVLHLDEVTVTAKKRSPEKEIYQNRAQSIAYYDVHSEMDDITDKGQFIGRDINQLMIQMNKNFQPRDHGEYLSYKSKLPLFVINYQRTKHTEFDYNLYKLITLESIKSIYINEKLSTICQYADVRMSPLDVDLIYSCVVFIETYPEGKIPAAAGKGVRKTWLEGYSPAKEFYSPDYSVLPPEPDYRRTLYWNPSVVPDEEGKASIHFYNNNRSQKFRISLETVSPQGMIGVYEE